MLFKSFVLVSILGISTVVSLAQSSPPPYTLPVDPTSQNTVPPSPEAWSFTKYGDYPVSRETGIPNISIPLHTIVVGQLSVPINLTYHASGIRVNDKPSWVGLGFDVNVGGVVTRTVKGYPDELPWGCFSYPIPQSIADFEPFDDSQYHIIKRMMAGEFDSEQDEFTFSLPGASGKFFVKADQNGITQPFSDVKIRFSTTNSHITEFVITTPDGIKYKFGNPSQTIYHTNYIMSEVVANSSWYLLEISSVNDEQKITFTYKVKSDDGADPNRHLETEYLNFHYVNGTSNGYTRETKQGPIDRTFSSIKVVESVVYDGGKIIFNSAGGRQDEPNDIKLNSIDIYGADLVTKIRGFDFGYEYFTSINGQLPKDNLRLKLISLQERGRNNDLNPPYQFTYLETGSYQLPPRYSFSQDYWGYYNGKTNASLLPTYNHPTGSGSSVTMGNANREPDAVSMKAGILRSITYPTKGKTEFEFAANDIKRTYDKLVTNQGYYHAEIYPSNTAESYMIIPGVGQTLPADKTFTLTYKIAEIIDQVSQPLSTGDMTVGLEDITAGTISVFTYNTKSAVYLTTDRTLLADHTYKLYVRTNINQVTKKGVATIEAKQPDTYQSVTENFIIGGLRVMSIKNFDENNVLQTQKHFSYLSPVDPAFTSGRYNSAYTPTPYSFIRTSEYRFVASSTCFVNSHVAVSLTSSSSPFYGTNSVNYEYVTEYPQDPVINNLTRSVYKYDMAYDFVAEMAYPLPAFQLNRSWLRGQLRSEQHFDGSGMVKSVDYDYDLIDNVKTALTSLKIGELWSIGSASCLPLFCPTDGGANCFENEITHQRRLRVRAFAYNQIFQWKRLKSITENLDGVQKITQLSYNTENSHTNVVSSVITNSDGKDSKTDLKYAHESYNSTMINKNMVGIALESKAFTGTQLTGGTRLTYGTLNNNFVATKFEQLLSDQSFQDIGEILDINQKGNAMSVKQKDGMFKTMLWDVYGNRPIIQMTASQSSSISTTAVSVTSNSALAGLTTLRDFVVVDRQTVSITSEVVDPTHVITDNTIYSFYVIRDGDATEVYSHKLPGQQTQSVILRPGKYFIKANLNKATSQTIITTANFSIKSIDLFYMGFEDGEGNSTSGDSKTGLKSKTDGFQCTVSGLVNTRNYLLTYWVKNAGVWTHQQVTITPASGSYAINLSGQVDEIRLYPVGSQVTTYAYDPIDRQLKTVTDTNNQSVNYEYDNMGRLQLTKDANLDVLNAYQYNFKQ